MAQRARQMCGSKCVGLLFFILFYTTSHAHPKKNERQNVCLFFVFGKFTLRTLLTYSSTSSNSTVLAVEKPRKKTLFSHENESIAGMNQSIARNVCFTARKNGPSIFRPD